MVVAVLQSKKLLLYMDLYVSIVSHGNCGSLVTKKPWASLSSSFATQCQQIPWGQAQVIRVHHGTCKQFISWTGTCNCKKGPYSPWKPMHGAVYEMFLMAMHNFYTL